MVQIVTPHCIFSFQYYWIAYELPQSLISLILNGYLFWSLVILYIFRPN